MINTVPCFVCRYLLYKPHQSHVSFYCVCVCSDVKKDRFSSKLSTLVKVPASSAHLIISASALVLKVATAFFLFVPNAYFNLLCTLLNLLFYVTE